MVHYARFLYNIGKYSIKILKNYAGTAPFLGAIWDEFGGQTLAPKYKKAQNSILN